MTAETKEKKTVITPLFRLGFNALNSPKVEEKDGKQVSEWLATMIFPFKKDSPEFEAMKRLATKAKREKWGDKNPPNYKSPFVAGEDRLKEDGSLREEYKGATVIYAKNKFRQPGLVNEKNQPFADPSELYAGCWCVASITAFSWSNSGANGVSFGLEHLRKMKNDEPLMGGGDPTEVFKDVPQLEGDDLYDESDDDI